jgi:hypothetical protein
VVIPLWLLQHNKLIRLIKVFFIVESLDELTEQVLPLFCDVENKNVPVPEWKEHPYGPEQLKVCWKVLILDDKLQALIVQ